MKFTKKNTFLIIVAACTIILISLLLLMGRIQANKETYVEKGCVISGCSGEICQGVDEEPFFTICIHKKDYECYKGARCEVQSDGKCGWTMDTNLNICLMVN